MTEEVLEGEVVEEAKAGAGEITEEHQKIILDAVRDGANFSTAAKLARLRPSVLAITKKRALDNPRVKLHAWALDVEQARAEYEESLRKSAVTAAINSGKPEAFLNLLERQFREEWVKPSTKGSSEVRVTHSFSDKVAGLKRGSDNALPTGD